MAVRLASMILGSAAAAAAAAVAVAASTSTAPVLCVSTTAPSTAGAPVLDRFLSYSIEHYFFPDFAGNPSEPNTFSNNLLDVIGNFSGSRPIIRVGGNTQDYATYNPSLPVARNGTYTGTSSDYPTIVEIGKSFFDSFATWPNTQYTYGFDFAVDNATGQYTLNATVPLACNALRHGKLAYWEMGNEPDLYPTSAQGVKRPLSWKEPQYVAQWQANTSTIKHLVSKACPGEPYGYMAPSFAGTTNYLDPVRTFQDGLDNEKDIKIISIHKFVHVTPPLSYSRD